MHGIVQGLLPLFDCVDEPFGRIDLLFDEEDGFFLSFVFFTAAVVFFQHFLIPFADAQIGGIFGVQGQFELAAGVGDKEIGDHIAFAFAFRDIPAGLWD